MRRGQHAGRAVDVDLDAAESRQGEQECRSGLREQPVNEPGSRLVPQRQRHCGRESLGGRGRGGKRQPEYGQLT